MKKECCNHDCNQGRNCQARLHQISEPTVNQQLTDEREAFGIPQCPFPCGWKNLHSLLVAEGAFLARSLKEDDPITEHQRATVMRVVNYGLEMARAALAATPAEKSNSVEFDGIKTAAPVLPEPEAWRYADARGNYRYRGESAGFDKKYHSLNPQPLYTEQQVRALLATGGQAQAVPVANCYSDDDGDTWRDCPDDCEFVDGRELGEEFELQASIRSWKEVFRVTKVPDETSDDYEIEPVSIRATKAPQKADARDAGLGTARAFIEWVKAQPEDREQTTIDGALVEFEAHIAAISAAKGE